MRDYPPLEAEALNRSRAQIFPTFPPLLCPLRVSIQSTYNKLKCLNSGKSPGPDGIPQYPNLVKCEQISIKREKYKKHIFQFKRTKYTFPRINSESDQVELVSHARILGLTLSN